MMDVGSRILYFADADEHFAEHELDYILFAKFNPQPFVVNVQEV
jgi:isopentenyldiphosphate isomerase